MNKITTRQVKPSNRGMVDALCKTNVRIDSLGLTVDGQNKLKLRGTLDALTRTNVEVTTWEYLSKLCWIVLFQDIALSKSYNFS